MASTNPSDMVNKKQIPLLVGITGGIGSGKSFVCQILEKIYQTPYYQADTRAKWLMENQEDLVAKIKRHFGEQCFEQEKLQRAYLASVVFSDKKKLDLLNSLVHPAVQNDFDCWAKNQKNAPYCIKEAALLFEQGSYKALHFNVLITAPKPLRIERIKKRDPQRSIEEIEQIMDKQLDEQTKIALADHVLTNDANGSLLEKIEFLHQILLTKAAHLTN